MCFVFHIMVSEHNPRSYGSSYINIWEGKKNLNRKLDSCFASAAVDCLSKVMEETLEEEDYVSFLVCVITRGNIGLLKTL